MSLDVEAPPPPDLTNRGTPEDVELSNVTGSLSDLRREELEAILQDGAWTEAFDEWAAYTGLSETEYRTIRDHGLIEAIDIYWDPADERLRVDLPTLPDELADRTALATTIRTELGDLGDMVLEMLEDGYVDWNDDDVESWTEETFEDELSGDE